MADHPKSHKGRPKSGDNATKQRKDLLKFLGLLQKGRSSGNPRPGVAQPGRTRR